MWLELMFVCILSEQHTYNQHFLNAKYDMLEHTQSKYIHNCVIKETQVAVWDMAPGSVDDCCFIDGTR